MLHLTGFSGDESSMLPYTPITLHHTSSNGFGMELSRGKAGTSLNMIMTEAQEMAAASFLQCDTSSSTSSTSSPQSDTSPISPRSKFQMEVVDFKPLTVPFELQLQIQHKLPAANSQISSSSSSSVSASASKLTSRHPRGRLESQRKYDSFRRKQLRDLYCDLRTTLKRARSVSTKAKEFLEVSSEEDEEDEEESDMENARPNKHKGVVDDSRSKKRARELGVDECSTRELVYVAADSIKELTTMKAKLMKELEVVEEKELEQLNSEKIFVQKELLKEETIECMQVVNEQIRFEQYVDKDNSDQREKENNFEGKRQLLCHEYLSSVDTLLHSIQLINQRYQEEVQRVRVVQGNLPRQVNSLADWLPEFGCLGLSGVVCTLMHFQLETVNEKLAKFVNGFAKIVENLNMDHRKMREPFITNIHAMCFLLSRDFKYRGSKDSAFIKKVEKLPLDGRTLYQMLRDSNSKPPVRSITSSKDELDLAEENELLRHPLGEFSLPRTSFEALKTVLGEFVAMGKSAYESYAWSLHPLAKTSFPSDLPPSGDPFPHQILHSFLGISPRQAVFHPLFLPNYEQMSAFHDLYSGTKPYIRLIGHPLPPAFAERIILADLDMLLVRHPDTGLPVAHLSVPRKIYEGAKWTEIEKKFAVSHVQQFPSLLEEISS